MFSRDIKLIEKKTNKRKELALFTPAVVKKLTRNHKNPSIYIVNLKILI